VQGAGGGSAPRDMKAWGRGRRGAGVQKLKGCGLGRGFSQEGCREGASF